MRGPRTPTVDAADRSAATDAPFDPARSSATSSRSARSKSTELVGRHGRVHPARGLLRALPPRSCRGRARPTWMPAAPSSSSTCAATRAASSPPLACREPVHRAGPDLLAGGRQGRADRHRRQPGRGRHGPAIEVVVPHRPWHRVGQRDRRRRAPGHAAGRRSSAQTLVRQGHRPAVAGAGRRGRRRSASRSPVADAGQALDPRCRHRAGRRGRRPGRRACRARTRCSTGRSTCSAAARRRVDRPPDAA